MQPPAVFFGVHPRMSVSLFAGVTGVHFVFTLLPCADPPNLSPFSSSSHRKLVRISSLVALLTLKT